jgi:hypothetical protein
MDNPWQHVVLPDAVINFGTGFTYLMASLLLFLPGWILTRKVRSKQGQLLLRACVVAVAFAPALFMDPGGVTNIVPASFGAIVSAILYVESELGLGFYFYHAILSILLVWCLGIVVGEASLRVRRGSESSLR